MASSVDDEKRALQRVLELVEAMQHAKSEDERQRILTELKQLAMEKLGVEGTA